MKKLSTLTLNNLLSLCAYVTLYLTIGMGIIACTSTPVEEVSEESATSSKSPSTSSLNPQLKRPPLIKVTDQSKDLLFIYRNSQEEDQRAMTIEEIPKEFRKTVHVVDLSLSPEQRNSTGYLQVFDLTQVQDNGQYTGQIISRTQLERLLSKKEEIPVQAPIVMYSTSWCGVCKKAKSFMQQQGLAFVEKDIEKDPKAAKELQEKARRAGVGTNGVPVIDIGGQLMRGFDPNRLLQLARASK